MPEPGRVERADGGEVGKRDVQVARCGGRLVERGADRDHDRRVVRAATEDGEAVGVHGRSIHLVGEPEVDAVVARASAFQSSASTSSGCPGTWIVQPGSVAISATSSGA